MFKAFGVALACEFSFLIGLVFGCFVSSLGALIPRSQRSWRPSISRALIEGAIIGLFAGTASVWAAHALCALLGVPLSWSLWLAFTLPALGEFGHFLNRLSLRLRGKPNTGVFMPLGRLHAAAWEFLASGLFSELTFKLKRAIELEASAGNGDVMPKDSHEVGVFALRETNRFVTRAFWGLVFGVVLSAWYLQGA